MKLSFGAKWKCISKISWMVLTSILIVQLAFCTTRINRQVLGTVAEAFVEALAEGDVETARFLTKHDMWPRLDAWFEEHKGIKCSYWTISIVGDDPSREIQTYRIGYQCLEEGNYYCLSVKLLLRQEGENWQVIDWGDISEADDLWCP